MCFYHSVYTENVFVPAYVIRYYPRLYTFCDVCQQKENGCHVIYYTQ